MLNILALLTEISYNFIKLLCNLSLYTSVPFEKASLTAFDIAEIKCDKLITILCNVYWYM